MWIIFPKFACLFSTFHNMKELIVKAESKSSKVLIGEHIENLPKYIANRKSIIITDQNLISHYGNKFPSNVPIIKIGLGEEHKTLMTLDLIYEKFVEYEADRSTLVIGIGGGIVCDVAGFAASSFMRGMPFGFVSTTLLSQVDASVGGKNGVNYQGFKNMIGVFSQPEFVICDLQMLETLDKKEYRAGFSEIIKAGAIKDEKLFKYCEELSCGALYKELDILEKMVYDAVKVKADVVEADEREKGERRLLNFGHTFAHGLEKLTGMLHGEAVSIGMYLAALVSSQLGMIKAEDAERIRKLLELYGLPIKPKVDIQDLFEAMKKDKKREGEAIHLVLLESIGQAVTRKVSYNELEKITHDLRSHFEQ